MYTITMPEWDPGEYYSLQFNEQNLETQWGIHCQVMDFYIPYAALLKHNKH